jgi:transcription initiation factor TFIIE subunit alpha
MPSSVLQFQGAKELLETIGGETAVKITKIYEKKDKKVTDEEVAKKLKLKVTEVRTILNRMHYRGVSCYHRTKNSKTGWYSYSWEIKTRRVLELLLEQHIERIEKLEKKKSFEENYALFSCKKNCDYIPFEIATEYLFKCPECGALLEAVDNKKRMKDFESQLEMLKKEREKIEKII